MDVDRLVAYRTLVLAHPCLQEACVESYDNRNMPFGDIPSGIGLDRAGSPCDTEAAAGLES